jgi:hypothetical protein
MAGSNAPSDHAPRDHAPRGHAPPATASTLANEDWYAKTVVGDTFTRVLFTDLELTEATLQGVVFTECTFRRAQFNCSTHRDTAFVNCTFANCSFFETTFTDCKLMGSTFDRSTLPFVREDAVQRFISCGRVLRSNVPVSRKGGLQTHALLAGNWRIQVFGIFRFCCIFSANPHVQARADVSKDFPAALGLLY